MFFFFFCFIKILDKQKLDKDIFKYEHDEVSFFLYTDEISSYHVCKCPPDIFSRIFVCQVSMNLTSRTKIEIWILL